FGESPAHGRIALVDEKVHALNAVRVLSLHRPCPSCNLRLPVPATKVGSHNIAPVEHADRHLVAVPLLHNRYLAKLFGTWLRERITDGAVRTRHDHTLRRDL